MIRAEPWHCGQCGYDLTGLRPVGRCPECGQEYDQGNVQGVTEDFRFRERRARRWRTLAWAAATIVVLVLGAGGQLLRNQFAPPPTSPLRIFVCSGLVALVLALATLVSYLNGRGE